MEQKQGNIGVTTEIIFPVIKKFLYSDHEIFLRELVSNAVDATQKLKTLASFGEYKGSLDNLQVTVSVDKDAGTLTVSDHGVGMTAEDIEKYINQIAFSGAEEFLQKYKDSANSIIGHFGLGFYSAFMVASKVEIRSLSYKEGSTAVKWECDGSPVYTMEACDKSTRGTDIILHIDKDSDEFLESQRIESLLKKYCRFLPVPVIFGKVQEWKDGKYVDTDKDNIVNSTEPLWTAKPTELTKEDYLKFYHELYPGQDDPLFWIHLNVDYPFTLTGVLFFPKIKNNIEVSRNRIQLYCNQVYVTDSVEGVVPEFLMLLQGVIDSPDIPLNVSRSYLQSDRAVKQISTYITKKVSSRLEDIFKEDRKEYEEKWDDIKLFIEYGMLTDQKFCDSALKFFLLKDTEGKYFTPEEYKALIEPEQTDKKGDLIYLYATDPEAQYSFIESARNRGYNVLLLDGELEGHIVGLLEQKFEKSRFVRVDSDIIDNLIEKSEKKAVSLSDTERVIMTEMFRSSIPQIKGAQFLVSFEEMNATDAPVILTCNEYMRRMKDMAAMQPGMGFYGELPDQYNVTLNTSNPLIAKLKENAAKELSTEIGNLENEISSVNSQIEKLHKEAKDGKLSGEQQKESDSLQEKANSLRNEEASAVSKYAETVPAVSQLIDLALLANGLLKGSALDKFIKRSVELL